MRRRTFIQSVVALALAPLHHVRPAKREDYVECPECLGTRLERKTADLNGEPVGYYQCNCGHVF